MTNSKSEEYPMHTYPDKLIKQCQKLIFERAGVKVTDEKAELYLDKFARLMKAIIEIMKQTEEKEGIKKAKSNTISAKP